MTPLAPTTPTEKHRANWLFVDLNSYFASVEQETRPELRGQPIGIIPIEAATACVIAASYQAKAYGVKTGMRADEALQLCPHIHLVQARPKLYVEYHHKIATAIERCIPIRDVMSCDEFASELMGRERQLPNASTIAYAIKQAIREEGKSLRCSIGLAPNRLLAKIAADMQKPDGLMVIERRHLPDALCCLKLSDIPGVGNKMEARLIGHGITTVRQLYTLSRERMSSIWGSVLGVCVSCRLLHRHDWLNGILTSLHVPDGRQFRSDGFAGGELPPGFMLLALYDLELAAAMPLIEVPAYLVKGEVAHTPPQGVAHNVPFVGDGFTLEAAILGIRDGFLRSLGRIRRTRFCARPSARTLASATTRSA